MGPAEQLEGRLADAVGLAELLAAEPDEALDTELKSEVGALIGAVEAFELQSMLQGPDDPGNAILTIHPGAGGTRSGLGGDVDADVSAVGGGQGLRRLGVGSSAWRGGGHQIGIVGDRRTVRLWFSEGGKGVHRLVRISPYDAQARRHTSFASVFVYPDIDDAIEVDLREEDIKMDVFRASGAGGQHVNKTSSAVRLTHLPTGIVVSCQQERSQTKNRATAMKMLRAALYQRKLEEQEAARAAVEATKADISWGNQIRSYVFQPYTMVNDLRTELKVTDVHAVMEGDLDPFIQAYLKRFGSHAA